MELALDCGQIFKNVSVVEFQIVQNDRTGTVMNELGTFVDKCRILLIGFDHEEARIGQSSRVREILRNAPD